MSATKELNKFQQRVLAYVKRRSASTLTIALDLEENQLAVAAALRTLANARLVRRCPENLWTVFA